MSTSWRAERAFFGREAANSPRSGLIFLLAPEAHNKVVSFQKTAELQNTLPLDHFLHSRLRGAQEPNTNFTV